MISQETQNHVINFITMLFKFVNAGQAKTAVEFTAEEVAAVPFVGGLTRSFLSSGILSEIFKSLIPHSSFQSTWPDPPAFPNSPEDVEWLHARRPKFKDEFDFLLGPNLEDIKDQINKLNADNSWYELLGDIQKLPDGGQFFVPINIRRKISEPAEASEKIPDLDLTTLKDNPLFRSERSEEPEKTDVGESQ